jgi:hypothetical protein
MKSHFTTDSLSFLELFHDALTHILYGRIMMTDEWQTMWNKDFVVQLKVLSKHSARAVVPNLFLAMPHLSISKILMPPL